MILILYPLVGFYENLIFENWHFHHPLQFLYSNHLVNSTNIFLYSGSDGRTQTLPKLKSLISSFFLSLWHPPHPAAQIWTFELNFCTSLAPPKRRHFGGNGSTQCSSIHLRRSQNSNFKVGLICKENPFRAQKLV